MQAKSEAQQYILDRAAELLNEARSNGFILFNQYLNYDPSLAVRAIFGDLEGNVYWRTVDCSRIFRKHSVTYEIADGLFLAGFFEATMMNASGMHEYLADAWPGPDRPAP